MAPHLTNNGAYGRRKSEAFIHTTKNELGSCIFPKLTDGVLESSIKPQHNVVHIDLDDSFDAQLLYSFCKRHSVNYFAFFSTVWTILLSQYLDTESIHYLLAIDLVQTTQHAVCSVLLDRSKSLKAALSRIQHETTAAFASFISDEFMVESTASADFYNTAVVFTDGKDGTTPAELEILKQRDHYVALVVKKVANHYDLKVHFSSLNLSKGQALNVASTFKHILRQLIDEPEITAGSSDLVSPRHIQQIWEWNVDYPKKINGCVHDVIERQVQKRPNGDAIISWDGNMSYSELSRLSTTLAHQLIALGVKPETIVPLCFEKSKWALVAIMSVLKAGGAFVFVDPKQPKSRTADIVSRVGANVMLTSRTNFNEWKDLVTNTLAVDADSFRSLPARSDLPVTDVTPDNILYLIFTSGSTGTPKGCVLLHSSFLTSAVEQAEAVKMTSSTRTLHTTPYTFDASVAEMLTSLTTGAAICIPGDEYEQKGVAAIVNKYNITFAFMTPSLVRQIKPSSVPGLRSLVLGGEALSAADIAVWADHLHLVNGYGPSECSVSSNFNPGLTRTSDPMNIGKGRGCICWVVDPNDHDRLVPIGAIGELLIQGPIVGREYFQDPVKTRDAFIRNPGFLKDTPNLSNEQLYKTGDLVRFNSDGSVNYIGRKDTQVKLRGQRLELGEIEHHLLVDENVDHAVVLLARSGRCSNQLTAVISLKGISSPSADGTNKVSLVDDSLNQVSQLIAQKVRERLSRLLPVYMVPEYWVILESAPRNTSGKMDRVRLRSWLESVDEDTFQRISGIELSSDPEAPLTPTEAQLQQVWSRVLELPLEQVGVNRSFIMLGGDSIKSMQVVVECRALGVILSVKDILQSKTLSDVARCADEQATLQESSEVSSDDDDNDSDTEQSLSDGSENLSLSSYDWSKIENLSRDKVEDVFACSPMQEGILLAQAKDAEKYIIRQIFQAASPNNTIITDNAIQTAWQKVVNGTPTLRTVFINNFSEDNAFHQVVLRDVEATFETIDLSSMEEEAAVRHMKAQPKPSSAQDQPDYYLQQFKLQGGKTLLMLTINHALIDGGSTGALLDSFSDAYNIPNAPIISTPYKNYISYIRSQSEEEDLKYWTAYLRGTQPCIVPLSGSNSTEQGQCLVTDVNFNKLDELYAYCRQNGVTVANVLKAAWTIALRSLCGSNDVSFGYVASGRDIPVAGIEKIIGPCINMLVCRQQVGDDTVTVDLCSKMQDDYFEGLPHQLCSLAKIQHAIDLSGMPLFNSIMSLQRATKKNNDPYRSIAFELLGDLDPTDFDIAITIEVDEHDIDMRFGYWSNIMSPWEAGNIADRFSQAIISLISDPTAVVGNLNLFSERDKTLIGGWNGIAPAAVDDCIHYVIDNRAEKQPQAEAICSWEGSFSYEQVSHFSTCFAHYLVASGVKKGDLVPFCFDKSALATISELAILKAGGVFVGLSPAHPKSRLKVIMEESNAKTALAAPDHAVKIQSLVDHTIIVDLDFLNNLASASKKEETLPRVSSSDPAYVCFTSGSTGKPKGIMVEHGSLATAANAFHNHMGWNATMRSLNFSAYVFDAHISDTLWALTYGGCICVATEQEMLSDLAGAINRTNANWSFLTPKVAGTISPASVPGFRTILLGGEAVYADDVKPWVAHNRDVFIAYGPTETTICAMATGTLNESSDPLNLGVGVGGRLWVVNPENSDQLYSVGTIGELIIEGRTVTRGYVNEPEKTKDVFIGAPSWFSDFDNISQNPRFYKTGDLVRYNPDGSLTYFGRKDNQVKIRGLRIELGEIEHAITNTISVPVIVEAVNLDIGQTLVAFCVFDKDASRDQLLYVPSPTVQEQANLLKSELAKLLPSYMVPSMFVPVSKIPLGMTGKADRRGLKDALAGLSPEELEQFSGSSISKRKPSTDTEKALHRLWTEVLRGKVRTIGADDSFFQLGGDSIDVMKMATAARKAGMNVSVADIFRLSSLSGLAEYIDSTKEVEILDLTSEIPPFSLLEDDCDPAEVIEEIFAKHSIEKDTIADIYPCAPLSEGLAMLSVRLQGASLLRSVYKLPASLDVFKFASAWQKVNDAQSLMRTRIFSLRSSKLLQVVLHPAPIKWRKHSNLQSYLDADEQEEYKFGSESFRYGLIQQEDGDRYFVWTAHHACYDGWMIRLLFDEITRVYHEDAEPIPEVPYNRFIKYLNSVNKSDYERYWTEQTTGETPASFPRLPSATYQPETDMTYVHSMNIGRPARSEITMPTVVKAAWSLILARYLDNSDRVVFGQTLSGRNAPIPDLDLIMGPAICVVPVIIQVDREKSVLQFLRDAQQQAGDMIAYEQYGIQNIRNINSAARTATDYKNVLITQTKDSRIDPSSFMGLEYIESANASVETYAMVVECTISDSGIEFMVFYDSKVISTATTKRMMFQFEHVLQQMISCSAEVSVGQIELISPQDQSQIMSWNAELPPAKQELVHEKITQQALADPDTQAIDSWDGKLTYGELDRLASGLAVHITSQAEVGPDTIIPLCFDRSMWTIVVMLAVLKTGSACVMFNPEHPVPRLKKLLHDTGAPIVLTAPHYSHFFEEDEAEVLPIDSTLIKGLNLSQWYVVSKVRPQNSAVVVFTSGSTGVPKGIVLEHVAICSAAHYQATTFGYSPGMRMLQFAHYTFDLSNSEIYYTLMHGGTVCIPSDHDRVNNLAQAINALKVDTLILTPTVARLIDPKDVPTVKTLTTAGEPADRALQRKWSSVEYNNGYGPAETTSWSSRSISSRNLPPNNVGHAVGCRYWIAEISDHNRLTPVGCVGEILIEGPIMSRGYLNQPEKTAEVYIVDPPWLKTICSTTGRVYKSGDLARYAEDGSLLIAGRKDAQVKFHGQRIELGEIEHHLRVNPKVKGAIVYLPKEGPCSGRLVGAIALKQFDPEMKEGAEITLLDSARKAQASSTFTAIRQHLEGVLAPYMVPTIWMLMDSVPLTPSRKINRNPIQTYISSMDDSTYRGILDVVQDESDRPETEIEIIMQKVWSDVLKLPLKQVSMSRTFFGLGGDSITAMQAVSALRSNHSINVTVKDILQTNSLRDLALIGSSPAVVKDEMLETPLPLSPMQNMYFHYISPPGSLGGSDHRYDESMALVFNQRFGLQTVKNAVEKAVEAHVSLRSRFIFERTIGWRQILSRQTSSAYNFKEHSLHSQEEVRAIVAKRHDEMDPPVGNLLKVDFIEFDDGQQLLSLVAHRLIAERALLWSFAQSVGELLSGMTVHVIQPQKLSLHPQLDINKATRLERWGIVKSQNKYGNAIKSTFWVGQETTRLLQTICREDLDTEPEDLLIAQLLSSYSAIFQETSPPSVWCDQPASMKEPSGIQILITATKQQNSIVDFARKVKDTRRKFPETGSSFTTTLVESNDIRFTFVDEAEFKHALLRIESSLFETRANKVSPSMSLISAIEIDAVIRNGRLSFTISYNRMIKGQRKIQEWITNCVASLQENLQVLKLTNNQYSYSDFPSFKLDHNGLENLNNAISKDLGLSKSEVESVYPCSGTQDGILLSQFQGVGTYDIRIVVKVTSSKGKPNLDRLRRAWQNVVSRHAILRTIFVLNATGDGHFVQLVLKKHSPSILTLDYPDLESALQALDKIPRLDATAAVPSHQVCFCSAGDEILWQIDISHSLVDGTALDALGEELTSSYERLNELPAPSFQNYISYIQQQNSVSGRAYWKSYLRGTIPSFFPALLPKSSSPKTSASLTRNISKGLKLQSFCETNEVSLATLFQVAWGLVLKAYTGMDTVTFGLLASGRDIALDGVSEILGPFISLLVCRMDFVGQNALDVISKAQNDYLEALPFQHVSLAEMMQDLDISGRGLINTALSFQRMYSASSEKEISLETVHMLHPTEWDVAIQVMAGDVDIDVNLVYWDTNMSQEQCSGVMDCLRTALQFITNQPDNPMTEFESGQGILDTSAPKNVGSDGLTAAESAFWTSIVSGSAPITFPEPAPPNHHIQSTQIRTSTFRLGHTAFDLETVSRAAWSSVMGRWSDTFDVVFGVKNKASSSVPFRVHLELAQAQSMFEYLRHVEKLGAEHIPFANVDIERIKALSPSAEVVCDFRNLLVVTTPSITITQEDTHNYALIAQIELNARNVTINLHYDRDILSDEQIGWIISHFSNSVKSLALASKTTTLAGLAMFGAEDNKQLHLWNKGCIPALDTTLHEMIKAQTLRTPDAEAVHAWDGQFTYSQLDTFSDNFSYHLRKAGVGPNSVVALCFPKCVWVPAVMISVLKAGGAFLSLNPEHSITRMSDQVNDTGALHIVTMPKYSKLFGDFSQKVIEIGPGYRFPPPPKDFSAVKVDPSSPAYLISTSGSTGKPKFPILEHRAVSTSVIAQCKAFGIGRGLRVMQFAAFTFDVSIIEIFGTLSVGGTICIASDQDRMNNLGKAMASMKVEFAHFTPTVLGLLSPEDVPTLQAVACGGEKMTELVVDVWSNRINLINVYGPTEASVNCACFPGFNGTISTATIGHSVGSRLWVTESEDPTRLAPIGCVGELIIEGPILSRGYLNEVEKTEATFVYAPDWLYEFGHDHGERVYRSGDLAKYNLDGTIAFLGRRDAQMKINGLRIEAGEVEFQIKNRRPTWKDVSVEVISQVARGGKKVLAAFIITGDVAAEPYAGSSSLLRLSDDLQEDLAELQSVLPVSLPPYMVPSMWISITEMPYTVSGKLDRKILRALLDKADRDQLEHYSLAKGVRRAPVTQNEITMAQLWSEVLKIPAETIGLDDTFFQLGGDSIIAMKLVSTAKKAGFVINVARIFREPRLADAAVLLATVDGEAKDSAGEFVPFGDIKGTDVETFLRDIVVPNAKVEREQITNAYQVNDLQNIALAAALTESRWQLNYFYFESEGVLDFDRLKTAFLEWVNRIEILRTVYILHEDKFWGVVLKSIVPDVIYYESEDVNLANFTDKIYKSGLQKEILLEDPLIQFHVVKHKSSSKHRIIVRISHAQYDGLSWDGLLKILIDAYEGRSTVEIHPFSRFVREDRLQHTDDAYKYWQNLLKGSKMLDIVKNQAAYQKRRQIIRTRRQIEHTPLTKQGITFATVIKAAWSYVLSQLHDTSDVVFGHTIAGRNLGGHDVIGPCINIIPVRVDMTSVTRVIDLLQQVQQQQVNNMPYETLGMREIIKKCTTWSASSFYNTLVQHQNIDEYVPFSLGETQYEQGSISPEAQLFDMIGVFTKPVGDKMEITMIWSPDVLAEQLALAIIDLLGETVTAFTAAPFQPLPERFYKSAILPLEAPQSAIEVKSEERVLPVDEDFKVETLSLLRGLWGKLLFGDANSKQAQEISCTTSIFDYAADFVQVAQLSLALQEKGYDVKVGDLLQDSTLESQVNLLYKLHSLRAL